MNNYCGKILLDWNIALKILELRRRQGNWHLSKRPSAPRIANFGARMSWLSAAPLTPTGDRPHEPQDREIVMRSLSSVWGRRMPAARWIDVGLVNASAWQARALAQEMPFFFKTSRPRSLDMPNRYESCFLLALLAHAEANAFCSPLTQMGIQPLVE